MSYTIAVAGKGGTGKTTLTGLLTNYLVNENKKPIIAIDADANANLNEVLGEEVDFTIGQIKEEVNKREKAGNKFPGGMTKAQYLKYRLNTGLTEGNGYDLLVMGRSEGEGCYCYVNGILKEQINQISDNYKYLVIDNEAGMEHLSRKVVKKINTLFLVSDCSRRGIQAVGRIKKLVKELELDVDNIYLIVNRAPNGELADGIKEKIESQNLDLLGVVPMDEKIYEFDAKGEALVNLPEDSKSKKALKEIFNRIDF
ncbi:MAG: carbon monoxide dehydrogenase [Firmicutes bacterium]|nr:carbon monoxide dehydrogenase [Bacillota bacterium]